MRASVLAAAVFSSTLVLGQGLLGQIPKCAQDCFGNNLGTCGPIDIGCICGNATLINSVSCCVFATCNTAEINQTITFATQLCSANNVQVNTNPTCDNASNSSTNATASASGSPSVTGVTGSRTAAPSSTNAAIQTAAGSLGLGVAMAGLLAFL